MPKLIPKQIEKTYDIQFTEIELDIAVKILAHQHHESKMEAGLTEPQSRLATKIYGDLRTILDKDVELDSF